MASRRNELSAQTFSRRRTVAAFLQPTGGGNEQDAPRPLRAVVPSVIVGVLAVVGFGAYGIIKPAAPLHWTTDNAVIVDQQTTTRYVILKDAKGNPVLHPVLNIASARLLLGAGSTVETVNDSVINNGSVPHGSTIGIPYAPDSLPTAKDAASPKVWSECDRPASGGQGGTDQKLFVLGGADAGIASGAGRLDAGHALYVKGPDGSTYLVDAAGTVHGLTGPGGNGAAATTLSATGAPSPGAGSGGKPKDKPKSTPTPKTTPVTAPVTTPTPSPSSNSSSSGGSSSADGSPDQVLATAAFGATVGAPQDVTQAWLATLHPGDPITIPRGDIAGMGQPSSSVQLNNSPARVGDLFQVTDTATGSILHYVVLQDGAHRVSAFVDQLLDAMHPGQPEPKVDALSVVGANTLAPFEANKDWPQSTVSQANSSIAGSGAGVICSVYTGAAAASGQPQLGLWAGKDYPVDSTSGSAGVYVTPGTGLLYRAVTGTSQDSGTVNLLTDTGLRYPVQINTDSSAPSSGSALPSASPTPAPSGGSGASGTDSTAQQADNAQARLGYKDVTASPVPQAWSGLLPAGPSLDSGAAAQQQGS
ncbi:type VII secretion protein EccB [Streptacidiphilus sp. EB129]|uniref:type VII secretion protein EccB n=1 Tax=Streptacidiphilus sp. EB129 TaxID=3156262 RepID=UPI003511C981